MSTSLNDKVICRETNFARGNYAVQAIVESFYFSEKPVRVLDVGVGFENPFINCSWEPYFIASYFESKKQDYEMTLIDICDETLTDIKKRNELFVLDFDNRCDSWPLYLENTNQSSTKVSKVEKGLIIPNRKIVKDLLKQGIVKANIPYSFKQKRDEGQIQLLNKDISDKFDLNSEYDIIVCSNVLYQLSQDSQFTALNNFANLLSHDGILVTDDHIKSKNKLLIENGGWYDDLAEQSPLIIDKKLLLKKINMNCSLCENNYECFFFTINLCFFRITFIN